MIRTAMLALALSAASVHAQDAGTEKNECEEQQNGQIARSADGTDSDCPAAPLNAADAAAAEGVTGFVPLIAPALGAVAAAAGIAAAGGGGGATTTTSTTSTN